MKRQKEFEKLTISVMKHKYLYYELNKPIINDADYDKMKQRWYFLGMELNLLQDHEMTPCLGFSYTHPFAERAIDEVHFA